MKRLPQGFKRSTLNPFAARLMSTRMSGRRSDSGFTLIELLVVIVIIGILASIALPVFVSQKRKAFDASAKSGLRTLAVFQEAYLSNNSSYGDIADLQAQGFSITPSKNVTISVVYRAASTGYCLSAKHANSPTTWYFDSQAGGLLSSTATACPTTNATLTPGGSAGSSLTG